MKVTKYNKDNILGWSEEDFTDMICEMTNVQILTGQPVHPINIVNYMEYYQDWQRRKLEKC